MDLYGKLNNETVKKEYAGSTTETAKTIVDNQSNIITTEVKKVPGKLTVDYYEDGEFVDFVYDGSQDKEIHIPTYYKHHIMISNSTAGVQLCLEITNKTSTQFTYSTLLTYFTTLFASLTDKIAHQCSGMETGRNIAVWRVGTDGIYICAYSDQIIQMQENDTTVVDTVEPL